MLNLVKFVYLYWKIGNSKVYSRWKFKSMSFQDLFTWIPSVSSKHLRSILILNYGGLKAPEDKPFMGAGNSLGCASAVTGNNNN